MDYRKFISHVRPGELKKNKYQYEEPEEVYNHSRFEIFIFNSLYCKVILHREGVNHKKGTPLTEPKENFIEWVEGFLNFHYSEYEGLKDDFLIFVETIVVLANPYIKKGNIPDKPRVDSFIARWIAKKEKELENETIQAPAKNQPTKSYSWEELFKDPKQAPIILNLLSEFLSSTGEWNTGKPGRYLVALCMELESNGYFINEIALTNPAKAEAFNKQFGTTLSDKNFQPGQRHKAEDYREFFNIPPYKPKSDLIK